MTVSFGLLRGAEARYGNRSCGGSVLGLANTLHAQLYGLPLERPPLPGALDELLQATRYDDDHNLVLHQVATQLEAAAALIERARHRHAGSNCQRQWPHGSSPVRHSPSICPTNCTSWPRPSSRRAHPRHRCKPCPSWPRLPQHRAGPGSDTTRLVPDRRAQGAAASTGSGLFPNPGAPQSLPAPVTPPTPESPSFP